MAGGHARDAAGYQKPPASASRYGSRGVRRWSRCAAQCAVRLSNRAIASESGYTPHIRSRRDEATDKRKHRRPARRWSVEASHSWFNRLRKLLVRYEREAYNYVAALHIPAAAIAFRFVNGRGRRDGTILGCALSRWVFPAPFVAKTANGGIGPGCSLPAGAADETGRLTGPRARLTLCTRRQDCWRGEKLMSQRLLYYPTFTPPSGQWMRQAVLYWDGFCTIVPRELLGEVRHELRVEGRLRELDFLRQEGLFEPLNPGFWDSPGGQGASARLTVDLERCLALPEIQAALARTPATEVLRISQLKMSMDSMRLLRERGVAFPTEDWNWWDVRRPVALLYMSMLARLVAEHNATRGYLQPCTDEPDAQELAFERGTEAGVRVVLDGALPMVRADAQWEDVMEFRQQRKPELLRFRARIDALAEKVKGCADALDARREVEKFKEALEADLAALAEVMDESALKGVVGSLSAVFKIGGPAAGSALGMAMATCSVPAAVVAGVLAGGTIAVTEVLIARGERERQIRASPVSYLLSAQRAGLVV